MLIVCGPAAPTEVSIATAVVVNDSEPAAGAAGQAVGTVWPPQFAKPDPMSVQLYFKVTVCPTVKVVPDTENVPVMVGAAKSVGTLNGPCVFDWFPARSITCCSGTLPEVAVTGNVSVKLPCSTVPLVFVTADPGAKPDPTSLAVQLAVTLLVNQPFVPFGADGEVAQLNVGALMSTPNATVRNDAQFAVGSVN